MRRLGGLVGCCALALACGKGAAVEHAPPIVWHSLEEGEVLAKKEHKPLVIHFGAAYELPTNHYNDETWPDPEVRAAMRDYIAVWVNCEDDEDPRVVRVENRFRIRGLATILIYDEERGELARVESFTKAKPMASLLRNARPER